MAFIDKKDIYNIYTESVDEANIWKKDYPSYERLANNDLADDLDEDLPEVNDGTLAASLFKLPKRIIPNTLSGKAKAIDRDEGWVGELANIRWNDKIIPNANSQAPFLRKWKDAVRKSAIYGSVPLITLFIDNDTYTGADFVVGQPQDVYLEPGKVSDYDSDIIFWDVYYTKLQLKNIIQQAKKDAKKEKKDGVEPGTYNKWYVKELEMILKEANEEKRQGSNGPKTEEDNGLGVKGIKFFVAVQRGKNAPFTMHYNNKNQICVREWSNPDPTGDVPIHYLYCYQDFINPYGIGIVKLAGGTQNVLDYMRQADVQATQLGVTPPLLFEGNTDDTDFESFVYAKNAQWYSGNAKVTRQEIANGVYNQLPNRIAMYKTSLNQMIPTGDTSISASAGDPQYSKTPAGVKFQAASLSIDDQDFKDNLYVTYQAVAKSMINTDFAYQEGTDLMKVSDEEREILMKAGLDFTPNEEGELSNQVDIQWDDLRSEFDFEIDPETDKAKDDADKLEGLMRVAELRASNPELDQQLMMAKKKLDVGELMAEIIKLTSDNKKIIVDISPEEETMMEEQSMLGAGMPMEQGMQPEEPQVKPEETPEIQANVQAVMDEYGVNEGIALAALSAEAQGENMDDIITILNELGNKGNEQRI